MRRTSTQRSARGPARFIAAVAVAIICAGSAGLIAAAPPPDQPVAPPQTGGALQPGPGAPSVPPGQPGSFVPPPGLGPLETARAAEAAGDDRAVITVIQQWLQTRPTGEAAAEAFYLIGKASWHQQQSDDAIFYLKKLLADAPASPRAADASALLGQIYAGRGSTPEAIAYLEKAVALNSAPEFRKPIQEQLVGLYQQSGNLLKAVDPLLSLRRLAETAGDATAVAAVDAQMTEVIGHETDVERLERLVVTSAKRFPSDLAMLRLADLAAQQHEPYDEEQWLKRFLNDFPKQAKVADVTARLRANADAVKAKSSSIGLLLPLSGPARGFGRSALRGAQVAWESVPAQERAGFGMIIRDSQSADGLQADVLERWAKEFHLVAVVGPMLGREMEQVAPLARRAQLPFVSPGALIGSSAPSIEAVKEPAKESDHYLFWNGLTLAQQARSVANYAVERQNAKRFMILYPDEPYARAAAEVFAEAVRALQGEVIASISYPPKVTDYAEQIKVMKTSDLSRYGTIGPPVEGKPPEEWPYTPGFDAIFLPGDAEEGGLVAAQLAFHGYEQMSLLGVGSWDRRELLTFGGRYVEGAVMADGFFAGSEAPTVQEFVRRYQMRYHEAPDLFAAQAYDAMRMMLSALQQGARSGQQVRDYLSGIRLYPGVSGQTTLVPGGPAQKQAVMVRVQGGKLVQVN